MGKSKTVKIPDAVKLAALILCDFAPQCSRCPLESTLCFCSARSRVGIARRILRDWRKGGKR